jgi:4'-phosphopantetheinyl transferase EntD
VALGYAQMATDEIAQLLREALPAGVEVGIGVVQMQYAEPLPSLHPSEEALLGPRATARRRVALAYGRAAARAALAQLGASDSAPIGRGPGGEPLWPEGVVGAISHTGEIAVAVVGWRRELAGLGVDLERRSPGLSERGARLVCRPAEVEWAMADPGSLRRTLLFSAKEAIFKALYPIASVWLGFGDAELAWDDARGAFVARVLKAAGEGFPEGTLLDVACRVTAREVVSLTCVGQRG